MSIGSGTSTDQALARLRATACRLNRDLHRAGLVALSFGNASVADRVLGVIAIKPSGIACEALEPDQLVIVGLADGEAAQSGLRPSSDTDTHLVLYRAFPNATAVIHTHSPVASSWAQAGRGIPCLGTTHADHFGGRVPVTRNLRPDEVSSGYTTATGLVITELYGPGRLNPDRVSAALVAGHGPFAWGASPREALENAVALELVASMAATTLQLNPGVTTLDPALAEYHHARKHGPAASYGQRPGPER